MLPPPPPLNCYFTPRTLKSCTSEYVNPNFFLTYYSKVAYMQPHCSQVVYLNSIILLTFTSLSSLTLILPPSLVCFFPLLGLSLSFHLHFSSLPLPLLSLFLSSPFPTLLSLFLYYFFLFSVSPFLTSIGDYWVQWWRFGGEVESVAGFGGGSFRCLLGLFGGGFR